jgi:hypothetical protein
MSPEKTLSAVIRGVLVLGAGFGFLALLVAGCDSSHPSSARSGSTTIPPTVAPPSSTSTLSTEAASSTTNALPDTAIDVYGNCTSPSVEPSEIVLTCADDGVRAQNLHWTSWTGAIATAVGTLTYNDCMPSCAGGHFHTITGDQITLTDPLHGSDGPLVWSEIQENPEPPGYATGPYRGGPQPLVTQPD